MTAPQLFSNHYTQPADAKAGFSTHYNEVGGLPGYEALPLGSAGNSRAPQPLYDQYIVEEALRGAKVRVGKIERWSVPAGAVRAYYGSGIRSRPTSRLLGCG